jgi:peptidoglycan/xylan/chitin deacetylase (PgdA/CDA1 family)
MYHQIADIPSDPWDLAVSPERFAQQIEALARVRRVVPLDKLQQTAPGERPLAAITFDDGYKNVATAAGPVLERFDCPATVFITTGLIGSPREFWWDEVSHIVLESGYTGVLEVAAGGSPIHFDLSDRSALRKTHDALWAQLGKLESSERSDILLDLAGQAGVDLSSRQSHAIMDANDVAKLKNGVINVGAHTVTHPTMPSLDFETMQHEVSQSRKDCQELAGYAPTTFAYPFGHYDDRSVEAVRRSGFQYAVTCDRDLVRPHAESLRLPRAAALNWDGDTLMRRLP